MPFTIIFFFGILAGCFALLVELLIASLFSLSMESLQSFSTYSLLLLFGIAFVEETAKYLFLFQYAKRFFHDTAATFARALLLGGIFGIGFASTEFILVEQSAASFPTLALTGTAGLHVVISIIFAIHIFVFFRERFSPTLPITAAVFLHTLYNTAIFFL